MKSYPAIILLSSLLLACNKKQPDDLLLNAKELNNPEIALELVKNSEKDIDKSKGYWRAAMI